MKMAESYVAASVVFTVYVIFPMANLQQNKVESILEVDFHADVSAAKPSWRVTEQFSNNVTLTPWKYLDSQKSDYLNCCKECGFDKVSCWE